MKRTPVRKKRKGPPRRGRVLDPKYLAFIRTLPCVCCNIENWRSCCYWVMSLAMFTYPSEAAHTGPHGLSQKSNDRTAIPLCAEHHRTGKDSYERLGKKFWSFWGLDRIDLTKKLQKRYEEEHGNH